jgi:hypothetical protein
MVAGKFPKGTFRMILSDPLLKCMLQFCEAGLELCSHWSSDLLSQTLRSAHLDFSRAHTGLLYTSALITWTSVKLTMDLSSAKLHFSSAYPTIRYCSPWTLVLISCKSSLVTLDFSSAARLDFSSAQPGLQFC